MGFDLPAQDPFFFGPGIYHSNLDGSCSHHREAIIAAIKPASSSLGFVISQSLSKSLDIEFQALGLPKERQQLLAPRIYRAQHTGEKERSLDTR
jgi:hypothetical protein